MCPLEPAVIPESLGEAMLSVSVLCIAFALSNYARDRNLADKSCQAKKV